MQKHRYSITAFLPAVLTLAGIAIYTVLFGLPSIYIFICCAVICYFLFRIIDAHRNRYHRRMHRNDMANTLIVQPNFRADETYHTEYNGFSLQIDHMRGIIVLVDSDLNTQRIRAREIKSCYYKADVQKNLKSNGKDMVRGEDTYDQLSLIIETKIPEKERLTYLCFDAWHCSGRTKDTMKATDKRLVQALEEVQVAVERIEAIKSNP